MVRGPRAPSPCMLLAPLLLPPNTILLMQMGTRTHSWPDCSPITGPCGITLRENTNAPSTMLRTLASLALVAGATAKYAPAPFCNSFRRAVLLTSVAYGRSHLLGPMQDRLDACGAAHCPDAVAAFAADGTPEAGMSINSMIGGPCAPSHRAPIDPCSPHPFVRQVQQRRLDQRPGLRARRPRLHHRQLQLPQPAVHRRGRMAGAGTNHLVMVLLNEIGGSVC